MSHIVQPKTYIFILAALFVLTVVTVWVAGVDMTSPWNDIVALTVAVTKATLVVLFFMHVKYSNRMTKLTVIAAVIWLAFLIGITVLDPISRDWIIRMP